MTEPTEREAIMSAAKHTPGPWHAKAGMTQMCDPESTTIARCGVAGNEGAFWWIFSSAEAGNHEADALLIAAVPDLLEALEEARNGLLWYQDRFPECVDGSDDEAVARIDAAIAKARGEQHRRAPQAEPTPTDMVLHCPKCGTQHIDQPDWTNDPHLGAVRSTNGKQSVDAAAYRAPGQSAHKPVSVLLRPGAVGSSGQANDSTAEVRVPAEAIHGSNEGLHEVQDGPASGVILPGQADEQPATDLQDVQSRADRGLEESEPSDAHQWVEAPQQGAPREESIRHDAGAVPGAPGGGREPVRHLQQAGAAVAAQGGAISGSLPRDGQDQRRAVLEVQHDAGVRERRHGAVAQRDPVLGQASIAPAHRSHLCRPEDGGCGHIWRPADVPTNGVAQVKTRGKNDSPIAGAQPAAWRDVLAERKRQIEVKGYEPTHDDEHVNDEIAAMACFYAMPPGVREWSARDTGYGDTFGEAIVPNGWAAREGDRRRELVKSGALILAEIERLDRSDPKQEQAT